MTESWPYAAGEPLARGILRAVPEDFRVYEDLGFEPEGEGEHVFLYLEKRLLNTNDLAQRLSSLSGVHLRDISFSGMKDRNAVTRQWFSVRMAGKPEPDWQALAGQGDVQVKEVRRHRKKLKRGVHRGNRFRLILRELAGEQAAIDNRLAHLRNHGVPNYFGEQRFGHNGSTLQQARQWIATGGRKISRTKRSINLSVMRAQLFNRLLAERVVADNWNQVQAGDMCVLRGTRSQFHCEQPDEDIARRSAEGDLHPALPLWGRGIENQSVDLLTSWRQVLEEDEDMGEFLISQGLELGWRACRFIPDDFCWQFCDDGSLQLEFRLGAGNYATALLAEFVQYR